MSISMAFEIFILISAVFCLFWFWREDHWVEKLLLLAVVFWSVFNISSEINGRPNLETRVVSFFKTL